MEINQVSGVVPYFKIFPLFRRGRLKMRPDPLYLFPDIAKNMWGSP
jgi:hypothetical protein